jgi:tetratricopeptide (TPR) repeat protein
MLVIGFLNYYYRSERSQRADQYYKTGNELLQQDRDDEAVQQFRDALSGSPGNAQYRLALGLALAKANHPAEASVYLNALLKRDPQNALANLGEARIAFAQAKTADAMKFYRRAIDGSWPAGQDKTRMQARFQLASMLEKIGQHREAAEIFREVLKTDDRNAEAYAGLGAEELALENYQGARDAFQKALQWNPSDQATRKRLDLTEQVLALDPNARGLRTAERYERSKELLQAEVMRFDHCQPAHKAADQALDPARKALASHPRRRALEDAAAMNLSLAEDLWRQEQKLCAGALSPNDATERVLARLSER